VTAQLSSPPPPEIGDYAPNFQLPDERGKPFILRADAVAGRPVLLVFSPGEPDPATLQELRVAAAELKDAGAVALLIRDAPPPENAALLERQGLSLRAISDPGGKLRRVYGLDGGSGARFVLLNPNQRIQMVEAALPPVLERVRIETARREEVAARPHPPVLIVPEALSRADCRRLIELCEAPGWPTRGVGDHLQEKGNYKIEINDYGRVDRVDFVVQDAETVRWIDMRLGRRVIPEILKAFQYRVTKRERFHIARYEGARGGFQHGHRDNPTPDLAHRRFALSLNLNTDDYEGGALRFPEYGAQRYRAETGSALVFSSSLLHEVLEVTSGRRYVLLSHLYGADGQAGRPAARPA
jgi:peroxiredoxin/predicted 2-oxoglutarate/Fe(II)-dependent dioxygenase YbiX